MDNPKDFTQEQITKIISRYYSYGYTTTGDVLQYISEALDIPENIAEWMLRFYTKLYREE